MNPSAFTQCQMRTGKGLMYVSSCRDVLSCRVMFCRDRLHYWSPFCGLFLRIPAQGNVAHRNGKTADQA